MNKFTNTEMGTDIVPQLYNLKDDSGETSNLATQNPEKLKELQDLFKKIKEEGRTRY